EPRFDVATARSARKQRESCGESRAARRLTDRRAHGTGGARRRLDQIGVADLPLSPTLSHARGERERSAEGWGAERRGGARGGAGGGGGGGGARGGGERSAEGWGAERRGVGSAAPRGWE